MFRFPCSTITPILLLVFTVVVVALLLLDGFSTSSIFAYHAVFMTIAFMLLFPLGVLSYVGDFGEALNSSYPDRASRRVLHGTFNAFGVFVTIVGYLIAFTFHENVGKSHLASGESVARQAHSWIGLITIISITIIGISGLYKFIVGARDNEKIFKWHGLVAPLCWFLGLVNICIAAFFLIGDSSNWTVGIAAIIIVSAVTVAVLTTVHLRLGARDHVESFQDDDEEVGSKNRGLLQ
jgi:hypothetical protein